MNYPEIFVTEKYQLAYVTHSLSALKKLFDWGINPSERVLIESVKNWPESIHYIPNPSVNLQKIAIDNEHMDDPVIRWIEDPSEEIV